MTPGDSRSHSWREEQRSLDPPAARSPCVLAEEIGPKENVSEEFTQVCILKRGMTLGPGVAHYKD